MTDPLYDALILAAQALLLAAAVFLAHRARRSARAARTCELNAALSAASAKGHADRAGAIAPPDVIQMRLPPAPKRGFPRLADTGEDESAGAS